MSGKSDSDGRISGSVAAAASHDPEVWPRALDHPLFSGLDRERLAPVLDRVQPKRYEVGDVVGQPGSRWPALHLLLEGRLCVYELTPDGRRVILDYLDRGGADGLLDLAGLGGHFSAAASPSEVASIPPGVLDQVVELTPEVSFNLLSMTVRRLHRREGQLELLSLRDPDQRLAGQLLVLAEESGVEVGAATWSTPRLSHEALADMLALRRETVTLHLGRLRRSGMVRVDGDRFIVDAQRLGALRDGIPTRLSGSSVLRGPGRATAGTSGHRRCGDGYGSHQQPACPWIDGAV